MSGYNTKQRRALLAFLGEHPDELLTARQMADALAEKQISLSAVYRNLAQLEAEEKVRRSAKRNSSAAKASIRWELTQSKQSASYGIIHRLQFFFQRTG